MRSLTVRRVLFLVFLGLSAVFAGVLSLCFGVRTTQLSEVQTAFFAFDPGIAEHIVVQNLRLPRAFAALIGGGALGLAGALMQVLTRNPLADPGLLGVNGGAAMGVVIAIWAFGITAQSTLVLPALAGSAVAAGLVLLLGGTGRGPDPTRLILAGAAISALFLAFTWSILILSRESLDIYRFWVLGAFSDQHIKAVLIVGQCHAAHMVQPTGHARQFFQLAAEAERVALQRSHVRVDVQRVKAAPGMPCGALRQFRALPQHHV